MLSFILLLAAVGLVSCAPVISKQLQDEAGTPVPFEELLSQPDAYVGRMMILGGYIVEAVNEPDGSLLTVLQVPLGFGKEPKSQDLSTGRFLVKTDQFLDPELYDKGRKVTVGGRLSGIQRRPLGKIVYAYPLIEAKELHLWPKVESYRRPYSPYWYDPWYYPGYPYPYRY